MCVCVCDTRPSIFFMIFNFNTTLYNTYNSIYNNNYGTVACRGSTVVCTHLQWFCEPRRVRPGAHLPAGDDFLPERLERVRAEAARLFLALHRRAAAAAAGRLLDARRRRAQRLARQRTCSQCVDIGTRGCTNSNITCLAILIIYI